MSRSLPKGFGVETTNICEKGSGVNGLGAGCSRRIISTLLAVLGTGPAEEHEESSGAFAQNPVLSPATSLAKGMTP